jgi:hypothetical protein
MQFDLNILVVAAPIIYIAMGTAILFYFFMVKNRRIENKFRLNHFGEIESGKKAISREIHDSVSEYTLPLKQYFKGEYKNSNKPDIDWLALIEKI